MLARGRQFTGGTASRVLLLLLVASLLASLALTAPTRGELPSLTTNSNATKTVTWRMNDPLGYSRQNVVVSGGEAGLDWVPHTLTWSRPPDFTANATPDANLTTVASGLALAANWKNRLAEPNFTAASPWVFTNGTTGNVSAGWDGRANNAHLWHTSPTTIQPFDNMDVYANWSYTSLGVAGANYEVTTGQQQGTGMQAILVNSGWSGYHSVALLRNPVLPRVNWSGVDRLLLWFKMNSTLDVRFNISAQIGASSVIRSTPPQGLVPGWQLLKVDLDSLAPAVNRSNLQSLKLQLSGTNVNSNTWFFFDALSVGRAKVFNETSSVTQSFTKDATTRSRGSAYLSFEWEMENDTGATWVAPTVSVGLWSSFLTGPIGVSHSFTADVSSSVGAGGGYTIGFHLQVGMNDSWASNVSLRIDNVSFVYPDRHNATYLSNPLTFGADAQYLGLVWSASTPNQTQIVLSVRSGNATGPGIYSWGPWVDSSTPGSSPLFLPGGYYFQVRGALSTTNASVSPTLESVSISARSRAARGSLVSDFINASSDFLAWRSFNVSVRGAPNASITFAVGDVSVWYPMEANASLASFPATTLRWRASFNTTDGLQTVALLQVSVTYDYLGPPVRLVLTPAAVLNISAGSYVPLTVIAYDAGSHVIPSSKYQIDWHTTDPGGYVYNNGTYHAVSVGTWNVTATVFGFPNVSTTIQVRVSVGTSLISGDLWSYWPYMTVVVAAAILGFATYELFIRRLFAIDDVFLIARDGRLIVHNTRRMRADRDEDILSGMLTAIMAFLRDQDPEENGELKRFEVGGKTTLLERGQHVYLAVVYSGRVPGWAGKDLHRFTADLEERFGEAFEDWSGSPEDLHGVKEFMTRFVSRVRYRGASRSKGLAS